MMERKRISIKEFRDEGYLQEANRLFFHPLGLALEVIIDEESGETKLGGVWDSRHDPEGILFDGWDSLKAGNVLGELLERRKARAKLAVCDENGIQIRPYPF
jgi:hypothetical protein